MFMGRHVRPGSKRTATSLVSREREEEFLHLLHVDAVDTVAARGQALLETARDNGEAGLVEGLGDGGELGNDVLAVATLLQHAQDAVELTTGALDPVDDRRHLGGVQLHCQRSSGSADRAAVRRRPASAATCSSPGTSCVIAVGSNASTRQLSSSRDRTTTLQGSIAATEGSAWSAAYASGGRQA